MSGSGPDNQHFTQVSGQHSCSCDGTLKSTAPMAVLFSLSHVAFVTLENTKHTLNNSLLWQCTEFRDKKLEFAEHTLGAGLCASGKCCIFTGLLKVLTLLTALPALLCKGGCLEPRRPGRSMTWPQCWRGRLSATVGWPSAAQAPTW